MLGECLRITNLFVMYCLITFTSDFNPIHPDAVRISCASGTYQVLRVIGKYITNALNPG